MKPVGLISAAALLLLFGAAAPGYAQQDPHDKDTKPAKQEEKAKPDKKQQEKPAKPEHQQEAKAQHERESKPEKQEQDKPAKPEHQQQAKAQEQQAKSEKQQQEKSAKQEHDQQAKAQHEQKAKPEKQQQEKSARNEHEQQANNQHEQQARSEEHQHAQRSEAEQQRQRSAPALRLSVRGQGRIPEERFHSNFGHEHRFRIGNPRIVGGYSRFQYGGYWFGFVEPWPEGWYYTDDVYVDYVDDGYYLYNPYYPGVRIAINVVM